MAVRKLKSGKWAADVTVGVKWDGSRDRRVETYPTKGQARKAETRLLIEHLDSEGSVFRSNHASNYLALAGTLNEDRARLIHQCEDALAGNAPLRKYVELGR